MKAEGKAATKTAGQESHRSPLVPFRVLHSAFCILHSPILHLLPHSALRTSLPLGIANVLKLLGRRPTGIVHENINTTEVTRHRRNELLNLSTFGDIDRL